MTPIHRTRGAQYAVPNKSDTPYRGGLIRRIQEVRYAVSIPAQENSRISYSWSLRQATPIRRDLCDPIWIKLVPTGYRFGPVYELTTQSYDESDVSTLKDPILQPGNHVKEIILKLNLPDHRNLGESGDNSNSKLTETRIDLDELCKKIFKDLQCYAFIVTEEEDVVDHIADFLRILDPIKIAIFDTNQLRLNIFPLSLTGDAKIWWLNERDNKITAWGMLAGRWGINDFEDDTVSSDEEWEKHEYGNPPNNSFPKPYLNTNDKRDKNYHKENNGDTNKSGDMVLSGVPHFEELTNGQLNKKDLAETMIWYNLKKTCVELIQAF
ncbi:hypothetical protein Tco_0397876 [Tanacetum coccineum]